MPQLVGIAGGSCAGKSWLAQRLQEKLGKAAGRLSLDDFYHDRAALPKHLRERVNFDHPRAIDWERLEKVLAELKAGRAVAVPQYNFSTHGRAGEVVLAPAPIVIMEGLWLFRRASVRRHFSLKIFVDCAAELREERRVERDVAERGRTAEFARRQFRRDTVPMHDRFVAPQARWADLVLKEAPGAEAVEAIGKRIQEVLRKDQPSHE